MKYGCKGKGVLIHLIADSEGMPLSACSKPADALDGIETGRVGRPAKKMRRLAADKGYDSKEMRKNLRAKGIHPQIPRKKNASARRGKAVMMTAPRFKAERTSHGFKKIQPPGCPLGKTAGMLQFVPPARHYCHSDAAVSGIDSCCSLCPALSCRQHRPFFSRNEAAVQKCPREVKPAAPDLPSAQDGRKLRRHKRRRKIERLSAWLQNFRRLTVLSERHADNFLASSVVACSIVFLR
ncbi:MAG: transposase [Candidatus Electronema sp. V4]|uniref:transposase n=1 Tax=Candidatus Electronema sp. V4 TaxID=3454756 RepID=UPI0040558F49